jgi:hypothetical protein
MPRIRFCRRLTQPGKPCRLALVAARQQFVKVFLLRVREWLGQRRVDEPVGARDRFGADVLDNPRRWKQHAFSTQPFDQGHCQYDSLVGLPRQLIQALDSGAVVLCCERLKAENGL